MIRLFTGLPGAGKTAHAVAVALELMKQGRPVFVSNMNGMAIPGASVLDDPRKWEDLPPDAVLIVDEAQRFFRASRALDVPPEVQAMETHRHMGIDFLLTTQQPNYLLKHLRGLVGEHTHHLRRTNASAQTWTWQGVCDEPDSLSERDRADVSMFVYPKHVFGMYTSTEKDTHKPGIPRKWKFIIAGVVVLALAVIFGPGYMKRKTLESAGIATGDASSAEQPGQAGAKGKPLTAMQYVVAITPRIEGALHTAPIFDGRKAVSEPAVFCISSGRGRDALGKHRGPSVTCLTEQGTKFNMSRAIALRMAEQGPSYNPYKAPPPVQPESKEWGDREEQAGAGWNPAAMPATAGGPVSAGTGEQQSAYGGFRGAASSP